MQKKKSNKLDLVFIIGIIIIGLLCGAIDGCIFKFVDEGGLLPIATIMGIFVSYIFWISLFVYSLISLDKNDEPKCINGCLFFVLPIIHCAFSLIGAIIVDIVFVVFNFLF